MNSELEKILWRANERLLFYGIGNVGRQDDGLGVRLVEQLEQSSTSDRLGVEAGYQLNIEDALLISAYDVVVFVDAAAPLGRLPFWVTPMRPVAQVEFSTHALSMQSVLALCEQLYHKLPKAYLLAIQGYEWGLSDQLSLQAQANLHLACQALKTRLTLQLRSFQLEEGVPHLDQ